jgi:hypothetical protein
VKILDQTGRTLAEVPCRTFTVLIPDPPTIVSPADNAELLSQAPPTFVWTPVQFVGNVRYNLKIAPLFAGQNRRQAIESNPPLVNQSGIVGTSFFYTPSLPSFSLYAQAIGWVWQVQAVDTRGVPVTRNEGRSEIGAFKFKALAPTAQRPPTQPPPPPPPSSPPIFTITQPPLLKMSQLKGRITYEYFGNPNMQPNGRLPLKNTPIRLSLYPYAKNFSGPSITAMSVVKRQRFWQHLNQTNKPFSIHPPKKARCIFTSSPVSPKPTRVYRAKKLACARSHQFD